MAFELKQDLIYRNARYTSFYDLEMDGYLDDLPFYQKHLFLQNSAILELGCGTGRLSRVLAQAGHRVYGVDLSYAMLHEAAQKQQKTTSTAPFYICMDMSRLAFNRLFDLIIIPFNTLNLLPPEQLRKTLTLCRDHLKKDGELLTQIFIPEAQLIELGNRNQKQFQFKIYNLADGSKVIKEILKGYAPATGLIDITERYRLRFRPGQPHEDWQYQYQVLGYSTEQWQQLFNHAGFKVKERYGDCRFAAFDPGEHSSLFLVAGHATT
ncbi:MAG: class I SAM-dependent methyltransferase [Desulfobulbaceae bacterium]|nr:class I SAM-dependent methyltransferase [Desulfobulbaceae bacterium]HIJ78682.1 class I SAM-dependent methyltransferase [Deltaproteobacteria bacterium]